MRHRKGTSVAAAAVVALLGAACGGGGEGETASAEARGGEGAFTLTAAEFAWDPGSLTASAGDSIELVNDDDAKHNLTVTDAGIDEDVEPGASVTVDLTGVEAGSYDFFCEYHPDMKGELEVE